MADPRADEPEARVFIRTHFFHCGRPMLVVQSILDDDLRIRRWRCPECDRREISADPAAPVRKG